MRKVSFLWLAAAAAILLLSLSSSFAAENTGQGNHARVMITKAVDDNARVALEGNTRPEANAKNDRGILAENYRIDHMQLLLRRPAELEASLRQFIEELHEPNSANYRQWMTA